MNTSDRDILLGCLRVIYWQLLRNDDEQATRSIEILISLIRYMTRSASPYVPLNQELNMIREIFLLMRDNRDDPFTLDSEEAEAKKRVEHNVLLYELCRQCTDIVNQGRTPVSLDLSWRGGYFEYTIRDSADNINRGTIYESDDF